jgi:uncharacterized protein YbjT (DUF2867 family)
MPENHVQNKTAIILGATGLTGGLLLEKLTLDNRYTKIKVFTRRPLKIKHAKVEEIQCQLLDLEQCRDQFTGDEVFCCIGTTAKKTPDKSLYTKIDYGIPVHAAKLCKENGIPTLLVISSMGANPNSSIFYSRTKGKMEQAVLEQNIKTTYILRPSVIAGKRDEMRTGERIAIILTRILSPFLVGPLKKFRVINAEVIAAAMITMANNAYAHPILLSDAIQEMGKKDKRNLVLDSDKF